MLSKKAEALVTEAISWAVETNFQSCKAEALAAETALKDYIAELEAKAKLKYYIFGGPDGSSDGGYFEIVLAATNVRVASQMAADHLRLKGRQDLLGAYVIRYTGTIQQGLLNSNVEGA